MITTRLSPFGGVCSMITRVWNFWSAARMDWIKLGRKIRSTKHWLWYTTTNIWFSIQPQERRKFMWNHPPLLCCFLGVFLFVCLFSFSLGWLWVWTWRRDGVGGQPWVGYMRCIVSVCFFPVSVVFVRWASFISWLSILHRSFICASVCATTFWRLQLSVTRFNPELGRLSGFLIFVF